jgi:hypothetical protein
MKIRTLRPRRPSVRTSAALLAAAGLIGGGAAIAPQLASHPPARFHQVDAATTYNATISNAGSPATVYAYPGGGTTLDTTLPVLGNVPDGNQVSVQCYLTATTPVTGPDGQSSDLYWDEINTAGVGTLAPVPATGDVAVIPDAFVQTTTPVNQMVPACPADGTVAPSATLTPPSATPIPTAAGSPSSTPVPVPTSPSSFQCRVDLRANYAVPPLKYRHMYVIYTDAIGRQSVFRAGPEKYTPANSGSIVAIDEPYNPGAHDWSTTDPSVTLSSGASACGAAVCFAGEVDRVNNLNIPYQAQGPNSNSFAYTILSNCGITPPPAPPFGQAPGWGKLI